MSEPSPSGLPPARLAVDGTSYTTAMTGAARRCVCLLPRLAARGWEPVLFVSRRHAAPYLDLPGVTTIPLPVPHAPAPARALAGVFMRPHLLRHGVTVLLTETPPAPRGWPFVLTIHDLRAWDAPRLTPLRRRLWARWILPRAARRAAAVLAPSEFSASRIRALLPGVAVEVAPNGCDHFPVAKELPPRESLLLAIGPWDRRKNLKALLDAYGRLAAPPPLLLVGDSKLPLPSGVSMRPADDVELAGLLRKAAAVVCPSLYEGFDLPLAEALAQGATVVASDIPVHREVAGDAAYYFDPSRPQALAAALRRALASPIDPYAALARSAAYSWRRCAELVDRVLRRAARRP